MSVEPHDPFQALKYDVMKEEILDNVKNLTVENLTTDDLTVNNNVNVTGTIFTTTLDVSGTTTTDTLIIENVIQDDTETKLLVLDTATNTVEYRDVTSLPHPAPPTTLLTSAGGETLVQDGTGPSLVTKGLTANANLTLTSNVNDVNISLDSNITIDDLTINNNLSADTINIGTIPQDNTETRLVVLDTGTNQFEFRDVSSLPGSGANPFDQNLNTNNSPSFQGLDLTIIPNDDTETKLLVLDSITNAVEYRNVSSLPTGGDQPVNTTDSPTFVGMSLTGIPQDDTNVKLLSIDGTTNAIEWVDKATLGGGGGNPFDQDLNTFDGPRFAFASAGFTPPANTNTKARFIVTWDSNPIHQPPGIAFEESNNTGAMMHLWAEDQDNQAIYFSSSMINTDNEISGSVNTNYKIQKTTTDLKIMGDSGKAQGNILAFSDILSIDNDRILVDNSIDLEVDNIVIPSPLPVNVSPTFDVLIRNNGDGSLETRTLAGAGAGAGTFETATVNVLPLIRANTTVAGYDPAASFVVGSQQMEDLGNASEDSRFLFDKAKGYFAAGTATAGQWDTRALHSAVFGLDNNINGGDRSIISGNNNSITGTSSLTDSCAIIGGRLNSISGTPLYANGLGTFASDDCDIELGTPAVITSPVTAMAIVGSRSCKMRESCNGTSAIIGSFISDIGSASAIIPASASGTIISSNAAKLHKGDNNTIISSNGEIGQLGTTTDWNVLMGGGFGTISQVDHSNCFVWCDGHARNSTANNQVTMGATGGMRVFTDIAGTTGVSIAPGASAWAVVSDINMKENLKPFFNVLDRLDMLNIYEYNYIGQDQGVINRGPIAQEWHKLFPSKKDPLRIDTMDLDGVSLAATKELSAIIKKQNEIIDFQNKRLDRLEELYLNLINK